MIDPNEEYDPDRDIDALALVLDYRAVMAQLEAATTPEVREERRAIAKALERRWEDAGLCDTLYEMAFGDFELLSPPLR